MAIYTARPLTQSATQVEEERTKREQQSLLSLMPQATHSKLSSHILKCWEDARQVKRKYQTKMLSAAKMRKGEYDALTLAAIQSFGGSEAYIPAANLKCTAAHDYIIDIYNSNERPYLVKPTPIPSLPVDLQQEIITRVQQEVMSAPRVLTDEEIIALDTRAEKEVKEALEKTAEEKAEAMTKRIDDVLKEGGWIEALAEVIDDVVTYPAGILKGPIFRMKPKQVWVQDRYEVNNVLVQEFERVSPFDFYPQRNIKDVNSGYCIERLRLNRRNLNEMEGLPGYNDSEIKAVLTESLTGGLKTNWIWDGDTEANEAEERDLLSDSPEGRIDGLEFWGSVPGQWLIDWGMDSSKIKNPTKEYQITAILIGTHVIRATVNPHPLGMKPYHVVSWRKTTGAFWGQGIPEIVEDIQVVLNAVVRALVNNVAVASGPQCAIDVSLLPVGTDYEHITPWKIHKIDSSQLLGMGTNTSSRLPIDFFQPKMQSEQLLCVIAAFTQFIDEYTGIPAYTHGMAESSGAGATSSGLAMLMTAAGKIIKNITAKIDTYLVASSVLRVFENEMQYNTDMSIKGDAQIIATGSGSLIAKEQQLVRMIEILDRTRNDVDMQIIGLPGRAEMLRNVFHRFELNLDHIIPDVEELMRREEEMKAKIQAEMMRKTGNLDQAKPRTLDVAGQPVAGQDQALFAQEEGAVA